MPQFVLVAMLKCRYVRGVYRPGFNVFHSFVLDFLCYVSVASCGGGCVMFPGKSLPCRFRMFGMLTSDTPGSVKVYDVLVLENLWVLNLFRVSCVSCVRAAKVRISKKLFAWLAGVNICWQSCW